METQNSTARAVKDSGCLLDGLPLFSWAANRAPCLFDMPRAARVIARRFQLPPDRARLVASLAGYREDPDHA